MKTKKMNTIKVLCVLFAVCTVITVLTGCGSKKPAVTKAAEQTESEGAADETTVDPLTNLTKGELDVNKDGDVNNKDVAILFRKLSKGEAEDDSSLDLNKDGAVSNKDVSLLFRYTTSAK